MVRFLAEKMVESGEDTLFGAMVKIMLAIIWTDHKKLILIHDLRDTNSLIYERSVAVSMTPPKPSQLGAWTTMICDGVIDAERFANTEFVEWVRESLNRRTILDV